MGKFKPTNDRDKAGAAGAVLFGGGGPEAYSLTASTAGVGYAATKGVSSANRRMFGATKRPAPPPKQKKPVSPSSPEVVSAREGVAAAARRRQGRASTMVYNPATGQQFGQGGGANSTSGATRRTLLGG